MFVLGITGGIGSGKSTVSGMLRDRGLRVLDADEISREVTAAGGIALPEIRECFGNRAINADGSMNRKYVSNQVFNDNTSLDRLSAIVHKYVFVYMDAELEKERARKTKCVVLDVPIPVKTGFIDHCNQIWVVNCDEKKRLQRLVARGMEEEDALRRISMQMTNDEYAAIGDHVIDNSGDLDALREKLSELIKLELTERGIRI